jgi:hypothetical protein
MHAHTATLTLHYTAVQRTLALHYTVQTSFKTTWLCRRKAAGWDGCRDRADGNTALPQRLMWQHPGHRSAAAAVYSGTTGYLVLYGGRGHTHEVQATTDYTLQTEVKFWNEHSATFCNVLLIQLSKVIGPSFVVPQCLVCVQRSLYVYATML